MVKETQPIMIHTRRDYRKPPRIREFVAQVKPSRVIHVNRRTPNRRLSLNTHLFHYSEVILPPLPPWVKEGHNLTLEWVNTGKIWPLFQVAAMARQGQILRIVGSPVLLGDNVFNVVGKWTVLLVEQAVFAAITGPAPDELASRETRHSQTFDFKLR